MYECTETACDLTSNLLAIKAHSDSNHCNVSCDFYPTKGLLRFESHRAQTAKTLKCAKSGVSANSEFPERAPKSAQNRTFAQEERVKCGFAHSLVLFVTLVAAPLWHTLL